jgi:hypothetical protein
MQKRFHNFSRAKSLRDQDVEHGVTNPKDSSHYKSGGPAVLEIAAGFEIGAVGAHELAFLLVELCPTIRAGTFDLLYL